MWERGKWAVYEEGGDRAIMGEEVNSLYSVFFFSDCGGGGRGSVSLVVLL